MGSSLAKKYICTICHGNQKYEEDGFSFDCNACTNGFVNFKQKIQIGDIHLEIWRNLKTKHKNHKWYIEVTTVSDNIHHYKLDIFAKSLKLAHHQVKKNINNNLQKYKQQKYNDFFKAINDNKTEIIKNILKNDFYFDIEDIDHCFSLNYFDSAYLLLKYKFDKDSNVFFNKYQYLINKLPNNLQKYFLINSL